MKLSKKTNWLEKRFCVNPDQREVGQAYFRISTFLICVIYSLGLHKTPYMQTVALIALAATTFWVIVVWRNIGIAKVRHIGAMIYDCSIIGMVMVGLGSQFIGLFGVLLWISVGYGIRYRQPNYLKLGILLTVITFCVSVMVTSWSDWRVMAGLVLTLIVVPLKELNPITTMMKTIKDLDEANKIKEIFISNVSHDLLTPINSIIGYCETLKMMGNEAEGIRISANQLSRQIRAIIGKTASTEFTPAEQIEPFSPLELLKVSAALIQPNANTKDIKVTVKYFGKDQRCSGPVDAISICLMNLASNAVKHSTGDEIELRAERIDTKIRFSVKDNGAGIPNSQQKSVFERFYRGKSPSAVAGLGLGLTIVSDTLEKIGSSIILFSALGETIFSFDIEVQSCGTSYERENNYVNAYRGDLNLLLVDDESAGRRAWGSVLRTEGYHVHLAASGSEGLAAIKAGNSFILHILDYRMDGMSGLELAEEIKRIDSDAKILIVSADVDENPNSKFNLAKSRGIIDYALAKPVNPNRLLEIVAQLSKKSIKSEPALITKESYISEINKESQSGNLDNDVLLHKLKGMASFLGNQELADKIYTANSVSEVVRIMQG